MTDTPQTPVDTGMTARLCHNDVGMSKALFEYLEALGWKMPKDSDMWTVHTTGKVYKCFCDWITPLFLCDRENLPLYLVNHSAYIEYRGGWTPDGPVRLMIEHLLAYRHLKVTRTLHAGSV